VSLGVGDLTNDLTNSSIFSLLLSIMIRALRVNTLPCVQVSPPSASAKSFKRMRSSRALCINLKGECHSQVECPKGRFRWLGRMNRGMELTSYFEGGAMALFLVSRS